MKKKLIAGITIVVVILGVVGAYLFVTNNDDRKTTTVESSTGSTEKSSKESADSVDITKILTAVKSKYPTVTETKVFTESNDPNGTLGKPGSYVSGGAFWDTRTEYSDEFVDNKETWGTDAGGAIEVYATEADAINRGEYFAQFEQTGMLSPGAYKQVGNIVLRVSSEYPKSVQDEVIAYLAEQIN